VGSCKSGRGQVQTPKGVPATRAGVACVAIPHHGDSHVGDWHKIAVAHRAMGVVHDSKSSLAVGEQAIAKLASQCSHGSIHGRHLDKLTSHMLRDDPIAMHPIHTIDPLAHVCVGHALASSDGNLEGTHTIVNVAHEGISHGGISHGISHRAIGHTRNAELGYTGARGEILAQSDGGMDTVLGKRVGLAGPLDLEGVDISTVVVARVRKGVARRSGGAARKRQGVIIVASVPVPGIG